MNLSGWRFLLFALAGAAGIVLLASIGVPGDSRDTVDRFTGERIVIVRSVADAYHEARWTGDARLALEKLEQRLEDPDFEEAEALLALRCVLRAELADPGTLDPAGHPESEAIAENQARALRAREGLRTFAQLPSSATEDLCELLCALEADEAVATATESYFAPLARWTRERPAHLPDQLAAHVRQALEEREEPVDAEALLAVARAFRAGNRSRARTRWLLRAYRRYPENPDIRTALGDTYVEQGRLLEAFLLVGQALAEGPDDLDLLHTRAQMAGWLSLPEQEALAREGLVRHGEETEANRRRLIELYGYTGRTAEAVPHARELTRGSKDPERLEWPARLALESGDIDRALAILTDLAREAEDPRPWREKIVTYARQDMRVERVVAELEWLHEHYPDDRSYETQLEGLYRRFRMLGPQAALLEERLERNPDDEALAREVIALHAALGHADHVRQIVAGHIERSTDPTRFFANLATYSALGVEGLEEHGRRLAAANGLERGDVERILGQIQVLLEEPAWQEIAGIVARRYPDEPAARAYLLASVDRLPTDAERAAAAERLARDFADDPAYVKAWVERASWSGDLEGGIRARAAWLEHNPEDAENRRQLAHLYSAVRRPGDAAEQWRHLASREGIGSEAALSLIDTLFAAGELEEAMEWLERRAALPGATIEQRLAVADQLFGGGHQDRALRFYLAILEEQPDNPHALLRAGQVRAWNNDPRGAIPLLERRLEVSEEEVAEVLFYLGEVLWAVREDEAARRRHLRALELFSAMESRTTIQDVMLAKSLAHLGREEEAVPVFERVLAREPDSVDLWLDFADALIATRNANRAREAVESAQRIDRDRSRTQRTDARVAMLEGRFEYAAEVLAASVERWGTDAGAESELGRALELAGRLETAHAAYGRSLALQPENRDVQTALLHLADSIADLVHGSIEYRSAGDDSVFKAWAAGSWMLGNERTRLATTVELGNYRGRAAAVDDGATELVATVGKVRLAALHRFARNHTLGGGIEAYPGAPGSLPVGFWVDAAWRGSEPYYAVGARLHGNLLWEDPAAAVSLGGRSSGLAAFASGDLGRRFWGGLDLSYRSLSLDRPTGGQARNGYLVANGTLGMRLTRGDQRVGVPVRLERSQVTGLVGPDVEGQPGRTRGPLVNLWANYQLIRLLDDQELATLVPIGEAFDYLSLAGRADFHLAQGLGLKVEGYAGYELQQANFVFGVETGLSWRPRQSLELDLVGAIGDALGRASSAPAFRLWLGMTYRW